MSTHKLLISLFEVIYIARHNENYRWFVRRKGTNKLIKHSFTTEQEAQQALEQNVQQRMIDLQQSSADAKPKHHEVKRMYYNHKG